MTTQKGEKMKGRKGKRTPESHYKRHAKRKMA